MSAAMQDTKRKQLTKYGRVFIVFLIMTALTVFFFTCPGALKGCCKTMELASRNSVSIENMFHIPINMQHGPPAPEYKFDMNGSDVIVFLHIQKTSGTTFGEHLVHDMDIDNQCQCSRQRKRCNCQRPNSERKEWLFSRFSTGWKCGLHADWTELTSCVDDTMNKKLEMQVDKRRYRYFYITILREPISRFISEFRHVQRGATWYSAKHLCYGRPPTEEQLPPCYNTTDWEDVSLNEFLACESNLAINRQTRMLCDLTLVDCYNENSMPQKRRNKIMLESAMHNVENMAYFGIAEQQEMSQFLFTKTFKLDFKVPFVSNHKSKSSDTIITPEQNRMIIQQSELDIELYKFALELFRKRVNEVIKEYPEDYKKFIDEVNNSQLTEFPDSGPLPKRRKKYKRNYLKR